MKRDVTTEPLAGYVSASELADFLGKSEMDIARLGKAGVLSRIPNPDNRREFLYELKASVRGYVAFLNGPREKAGARFTTEKARTQRLMSQKLRLEIEIKEARLIPREAVLKELVQRITVFKRRVKAIPSRVSGAFALEQERRRELEGLLEIEVTDTLAVLVTVFDGLNDTNGQALHNPSARESLQ